MSTKETKTKDENKVIDGYKVIIVPVQSHYLNVRYFAHDGSRELSISAGVGEEVFITPGMKETLDNMVKHDETGRNLTEWTYRLLETVYKD